MISILNYATKSIIRNRRRSSTLMIGIIISLTIISGVLFYVDSASTSMIDTALNDVNIDVSVSLSNPDNDDMSELWDYASNDLSDLITGTEFLSSVNPFFFRSGGALLSTEPIPTTLTRSTELNASATYIFGINSTYFETFDLFETSLDLTEIESIFDEGEVLATSQLMTELALTDNQINLTIIESQSVEGGGQAELTTVATSELTIADTVEIDMEILQDLVSVFYPDDTESTSLLNQFANTPNAILMDYSQMILLMSSAQNLISSNSIQIKVDHSILPTDLDDLNLEISGLTSKLEVFFPDSTVNNLLYNSLEMANDQLDQMKLFLLYFSIPGLLLGIFISKYAIDLNIGERSREIGLLRTKAAKRKQIASAIALENSIISFLGMLIGIGAGYILSNLISGTLGSLGSDNSFELITVRANSLYYSLLLGTIIGLTASILSTRQLLSPNVVDLVNSKKDVKSPIWRRFKLDFILLTLVGIIFILVYSDFDLIPDFAVAVYDLLAPILTWIGISLLLIRFFGDFMLKLSGPLYSIYDKIFGNIARIIIRNITHRPKKLATIAILLTLATSFGMNLAIISDSYQDAALIDANYIVGSDIRIQFPGSDYIDYNTSDFSIELLSAFSDSIELTTDVFTTSVRFGRTGVSIIGIDPNTFFNVLYLEDYFFSSDSIDSALNSLTALNDEGIANTVLFSSALINPTSTTTTSSGGGRGGGTSSTITTTTFGIGDEVPFNVGDETLTVQIGDVAEYFPSVSDVTSRIEGEIPFAVMNIEYLENPGVNVTLLQNGNASLSYIKVIDGVDSKLLVSDIESWYALEYPESDDLIIKDAISEMENYQMTIDSLLGLTTMEYILILTITFLGMQIFLSSSILERKREFGTYFAIGAPVKDIRKLLFGELTAVVVFSMIVGVLLSFIMSFMYLGFLSDLLILEISSISVPIGASLTLIGLELIGVILAIMLSSSKLAKLDPANILRAI